MSRWHHDKFQVEWDHGSGYVELVIREDHGVRSWPRVRVHRDGIVEIMRVLAVAVAETSTEKEGDE